MEVAVLKNRNIFIVMIIVAIVLSGCNYKNDNLDIDSASNVDSERGITDIVEDSVKQYPELETTDFIVLNFNYGPILVSPYAEDDVIKAATHVICDTQIEAYCYGDYLFDKYDDDFSQCSFDDVYKLIQSRVKQARTRADLDNKRLLASLKNDPEVNISSSGEYYYILDLNNFEESATAIQASVDRQYDVYDEEMQMHWYNYFDFAGKEFIGGYRGPSYSIYLNEYSPENKIYEYYYLKVYHEFVDIYSDLYALLIYDYTSISEKMVEEKDIKKTLTCTSNLDSLTYTYRMMTDDFDLTEAVELAYEVYVNVNEANSEYNTYMIDGLYVCINNYIDYNKDYQNIYVFLPFEEDYSFEEFEKILNDNIEICRDAEPV